MPQHPEPHAFFSADEGVSEQVQQLLDRCSALPPLLTGVVYPCSGDALRGALEAAERQLIQPVLYGPEPLLRQIAKAERLDLSACRVVAADSAATAAQLAASDAGRGQVHALMKGSLHSDVFLHAILQHDNQLLIGRLLSHCAVGFLPGFKRLLFLSDAALNIAPSTDQKREICQNAIDFAIALGVKQPKVAVLAAVELVNPHMPATLDGALLAKMADRRQIVGALVDGPLDLDAAISPEAARTKQITSPVAGQADILLAPDIEAGNLIYKVWSFMGPGVTAGLVLGARVPLILTSRADHALSRLLSTALATLLAHPQPGGTAATATPKGV